VIGAAVMGENLSMNLDSKDIPSPCSTYLRQGQKLVEGRAKGGTSPVLQPEELVDSLKTPRMIMMMEGRESPWTTSSAADPAAFPGRHPYRRGQFQLSGLPYAARLVGAGAFCS
jgi:hypothetical protein